MTIKNAVLKISRFFFSYILPLFFSSIIFSDTHAQEKPVIRGIVKDSSNGNIIRGADIHVKNTSLHTQTDRMGQFSIAVDSAAVLVFSYSGMQFKEVTVQGRDFLTVNMIPAESGLNDVVVVGYSSVRKKDLTGAVSQANIEDMSKAPVPSFGEALAGRVSGVQVQATDGQPGSVAGIVIRGPGSLTQNTSPLYVVDGFPVEDMDPALLNMDDIESFTILKDASSTAIYGSRASNGVIVIQTKKGKGQKMSIDAGATYGLMLNRKKIELMSVYEYVKYQLERFPGADDGMRYLKDGKTLEDYKNIKGLDLQDHVFTRGAIGNYNLALRGGSEKTRYSLSGSYTDQQGIVINTGMKKYTSRLALDQVVNSRLKTGVVVGYSGNVTWGQVINTAQSASTSSSVMGRVWGYRPIQTPGDSTDLLDSPVDEEASSNFDFRVNPLIDLQNQYIYNYHNLFEASGYVTYDISNDFTLKFTGGTRRNQFRYDKFFSSKTTAGSPFNINNADGVNASILNVFFNSVMMDNTLTYRKTVNGLHNITAVALMGMQKEDKLSNGYSGRLLPNEALGIRGINEGVVHRAIDELLENARLSFGGRIDYGYLSKYLFTFTFRADASSKFPANRKWGYFPGAAAAWNIHEEPFLKNNSVISFLKLRTSYGQVGNDRVSDYASFASIIYNLNGYSFNDAIPLAMAYPGAIANPDLSWEKTTSTDMGLEVGLLNNKINITADVYKRTTNNLLLNANLPLSTGFSTAYKNVGSLENRGLEIAVNTKNIKSDNFSWESSFNISFNQNKILSLTEGQRFLSSAISTDVNYSDMLYKAEIGKPSGMMVGYIWEGNYQYEHFDNPAPGVYILKPEVPTNGKPRNTIRPGDIKYRDLNGDGVVNSDDKTIIGRGQPIHTGGFNNNLTYKNLSLNLFFQWSYGNDIYNGNRITFEGNPNARRNTNQFASYVNRWTPENPTNENFRAGGEGVIGYHSSKYVEDGSYLRLKTAMLSYTLPTNIVRKWGMSMLALNVAVQNLFTWTKYSGLDPEVSVRRTVLTPGYDYSAYPQSRTIVLGIKVSL